MGLVTAISSAATATNALVATELHIKKKAVSRRCCVNWLLLLKNPFIE